MSKRLPRPGAERPGRDIVPHAPVCGSPDLLRRTPMLSSRPLALWSVLTLLPLCPAAVPDEPDEPIPLKRGEPEKLWLFVGTYTPRGGPSKGIYRLELDVATGKLSKPELAATTVDPSFLAIAPEGRRLYA